MFLGTRKAIMKTIEKEEMFAHVSQFLKGKGIELKDGSYVRGIQKSCGILTDAINLSQQGLERARSEIEKRMDRMRGIIHEKTAPRRSSAGGRASASGSTAEAATPKGGTTRARKAKTGNPTRKSAGAKRKGKAQG